MKVRWTRGARSDRRSAIRFIARRDADAAARLDDLFDAAARRLKDFPEIGRPGEIAETREVIPHRSYHIVYELRDDTVYVLALVHTSRRWPPEAR